jgi:gliding motility-associated-like protein
MYIIQASDGRCVSKDTLVIKTVYPLPVVALGDDLVICKDSPKVFDAGSGYVSYTWQDGSGSSTYSATQPGVYWVLVTDSNHCSGADTAMVTGVQYCKKGIYFPNAFTPGSGSNASWRPVVIDGVPGGYRLQIFNRFGQKLFESTNPQSGWDGSWQGKPQPTGSFAWFCSYRFAGQEQKVEKGTFLLLR